jgi:hypothetical protein
LVEGVGDGGGQAAPAPVLEIPYGDAELEGEGVLGVEVASVVATHDLQLAVDGLDGIGRGKGAADRVGILDEGEVVLPLFAELGDEGGVARLESVTEVLELCGGDFFAALTARMRLENSKASGLLRWVFAFLCM